MVGNVNYAASRREKLPGFALDILSENKAYIGLRIRDACIPESERQPDISNSLYDCGTRRQTSP